MCNFQNEHKTKHRIKPLYTNVTSIAEIGGFLYASNLKLIKN